MTLDSSLQTKITAFTNQIKAYITQQLSSKANISGGVSEITDTSADSYDNISTNLTNASTQQAINNAINAKIGTLQTIEGSGTVIDVVKQTTPDANNSLTYVVKQDGTKVGTSINIPTGNTSQAGILQLGTTDSTAAQGNHIHDYSAITSKPSFTQDSGITSSTTGRYAIGTINISGSSVTMYGKDTNTTYSKGDGLLLSSNTFSADFGTGNKQVARGDHTHAYSAITDKPTIDSSPANNANNLVSSQGVYNALAGKADTHSHPYLVNNANTSTSYNITASKFIKNGGNANQFLKADGSVDDHTYSTIGHKHDGWEIILSNNELRNPAASETRTINGTFSVNQDIQMASLEATVTINFGVTGTTDNIIYFDEYLPKKAIMGICHHGNLNQIVYYSISSNGNVSVHCPDNNESKTVSINAIWRYENS